MPSVRSGVPEILLGVENNPGDRLKATHCSMASPSLSVSAQATDLVPLSFLAPPCAICSTQELPETASHRLASISSPGDYSDLAGDQLIPNSLHHI